MGAPSGYPGRSAFGSAAPWFPLVSSVPLLASTNLPGVAIEQTNQVAN